MIATWSNKIEILKGNEERNMVCTRKYFPWLCAGMDLDWRDNVLIRSEDFCKGFSFSQRQIQQEQTCFILTRTIHIYMGPQKKRGGWKRGKFHPVRCWACLISINSFSVQLLRPATFWGTLEIFSSMLLFVPICPGELALYLYHIYAFECINQFLVPCVCLTILSAQSHESPEGGNASHTQNMYSENIQS